MISTQKVKRFSGAYFFRKEQTKFNKIAKQGDLS